MAAYHTKVQVKDYKSKMFVYQNQAEEGDFGKILNILKQRKKAN